MMVTLRVGILRHASRLSGCAFPRRAPPFSNPLDCPSGCDNLPNSLLCRSKVKVSSGGLERVSLLDLFQGQGPEGGDVLSLRQPTPQPPDEIARVSERTG